MRLLHSIGIWSVTSLIFLSTASANSFRDWTLNLIQKNKLNPDHFSLYWSKLDGSLILDHRSQVAMTPASITKIVTASAILEYLPPGTKFKTRLMSSAKIVNTKLEGPLFLVGGGDPGFVSENMWVLVNNFLRSGVREIEGDLVVDDSLFDRVRYDDSRESSRVDRAYDAPVGAMSFNWNSMNVYVRPTEKGKPAQVYLDPENDYLVLENRTQTVAKGAPAIDVDRKWNEKTGTEVVTVRGTIGKEVGEHVVFANVSQPDIWAGKNLKAFLQQRGIRVRGGVKVGSVPSSAEILAEVESKPVEFMLADMNKFSNNFVAEMLTKNVAALSEKPATLKTGMKKVNEHLKSEGFDEKEFLVENPSGLTRENRMTTLALWKLLARREKDFRSMPEFMNSFPIAGVDGTLKRRLKGDKTFRQIRAKTGLLNGVTSLAGYASEPNEAPTAFAFIYNGPGDSSRVRAVMDQIFERYYSHK
ncbi:MAG: D-alanyl-D-alanine carboxypeptidase/D-alanyl-D-alanine-endopeptidase [Bdellovibrionales bacterium]